MRKITIVLSVLVLAALLLTACGAGEEKNERNNTQVPNAGQATSTETASPGNRNTTTTPGIPVTGEENAARLSKELGFQVSDKNGNQIGDVKDMVLDFDNAKVAYVVVGTGGFLGIGEKKILVPWNNFKLQTPANGGQKNEFVFQMDPNVLKNAPDVDLSTIPPLGQAAGDWDAQISRFWKNGAKPIPATNTPSANATVAPTMTPAATAAPNASAGPVALKGMALASKVLGSTVGVGTQAATGNNAGTGKATATPGTGASGATATPSSGTRAQNNVNATIKDMIMDMQTGKVRFLVVDAKFDDGEHWIPIPANLFQWDAAKETFVLKTDVATLQKAPSFQEDQFPNTGTSGWDTEFNKFWRGK